MEKLNSDEKMSILMKLTASEIVKVCQTNKELSRACGDSRYNPLWYQKIREDFNIIYKGQNAYEEYKRLFLLYHTEIYTVIIADTNQKEYFSHNFLTREEAETYIQQDNSYGKDLYAKIVTSLKYNDRFRHAEVDYTISTGYIKKELNENLVESKRDYENKTEKFYNLFKGAENGNEIIERFNKLLSDIMSDIQASGDFPTEDYIQNSVPEAINEFIQEHNLEKYKKEINDYVKYIL